MKNNCVIFIDWGSTNLRAWLCDKQGNILQQLSSAKGVARINRHDIPAILNEIIDGWGNYYSHQPVKVIMSGMIGSERGLGNTPYLTCPVNLAQLRPVKAAISDAAMSVTIIPGICSEQQDNHNVMRGEETQLLGAWQDTGSRLFLLPGTHSKWAEVSDGIVTRFHTAITGELYQLLMSRSLIGMDLPPQQQDSTLFHQGVARGLRDARLLATLFEVRAGYLLHHLPQERVGDYLSGLLIGNEIQQLSALYPLRSGERITVIGGGQLTARYCAALDLAGIASRPLDGSEAVIAGMRRFINELA